jgi:S-adenosylmethionine:tRNA ribosyltransferase-isomerase
LERLSDYDYHLPPERIAQRPLEDRAASKLLWLHRDSGEVSHHAFRDVPSILEPGDLLVMNDTRVTALRLLGQKPTGGQVELLLLKQVSQHEFEALAKPGKRLQPGATVNFESNLKATILQNLPEGRKLVAFESAGNLDEKLAKVGTVPLPPYIHEKLADPERYQTVYASQGGSSAAPTAGLHFTPEILNRLRKKGVETARVALDVGIDTFRPVQSEHLSEHHMHGERCSVPAETAAAIERCAGRIVAVGTTSVRTLESFAVGPRRVEPGTKSTDLFILPGYEFKVISGMFSNFHMPRTTMLIMISALAGRSKVLNAYEEALQQDYRFLSFGDSMLIL